MDEEKFSESMIEAPFIPRRGQIIEGTIIRVGRESVFVDINYKSEGIVPLSEFPEDGRNMVKPGEQVRAVVQGFDSESGMVRLSKAEADRRFLKEELKRCFESSVPVSGIIERKIKGGFEVSLTFKGFSTNISAFLPASHLDVRKNINADSFLGRWETFLILDPGTKTKRPVVSRASYIERTLERKKEKLMEMMRDGKKVHGLPLSIKDFGVFFDVEGVEVLVMREELSWKRFEHPEEVIKKGEEYPIILKEFNEERGRFIGSVKAALPDPWEQFLKKNKVGDTVEGRVTGLTSFGAFVEIAEGVEGLIHVSELSWSRNVKKPSDVLHRGDRVRTKIIRIEPDKRKVSLSLRQMLDNPLDDFIKKYPEGSRVKGKVAGLTPSKVFLALTEELEGVIKKEDISWERVAPDPRQVFKMGDEVEAVVLGVDKKDMKVLLGVKQLSDDPWQSLPVQFPLESKVKGTVSAVSKKGVFVKLTDVIEGFMPRSEIRLGRDKTLEGTFEKGQEVEALVIEVNPSKKRLILSKKKLEEKEEQEELEKIMRSGKKLPTLGEQFGHLFKES